MKEKVQGEAKRDGTGLERSVKCLDMRRQAMALDVEDVEREKGRIGRTEKQEGAGRHWGREGKKRERGRKSLRRGKGGKSRKRGRVMARGSFRERKRSKRGRNGRAQSGGQGGRAVRAMKKGEDIR